MQSHHLPKTTGAAMAEILATVLEALFAFPRGGAFDEPQHFG